MISEHDSIDKNSCFFQGFASDTTHKATFPSAAMWLTGMMERVEHRNFVIIGQRLGHQLVKIKNELGVKIRAKSVPSC